YRPRQREQALLDEDGHLADITDGLLPFLEDARLPLDAAAQLVDLGLVVAGLVLELAQLENRRPDLVGKFLLLAGKSFDPVHHLATLLIERPEQAGENELRLLLALGRAAGDDLRNPLL